MGRTWSWAHNIRSPVIGRRSGLLWKLHFQDTETSACPRLGLNRTTDNPIPALPHPPGNNQQCLPLVLGGWRESGETPLWCRHTGKLRLEKAHWEKSFLAHGDANQWNKQTCTTLSTILTWLDLCNIPKNDIRIHILYKCLWNIHQDIP